MRHYPRTKFADSNGIYQQISHIVTEIKEFGDAEERAYMQKAGGFNNYDVFVKAMMLEAHDIIQSAYTLMDILEREYPGQAWSALEEMVEKNRVRDYYREGE